MAAQMVGQLKKSLETRMNACDAKDAPSARTIEAAGPMSDLGPVLLSNPHCNPRSAAKRFDPVASAPCWHQNRVRYRTDFPHDAAKIESYAQAAAHSSADPKVRAPARTLRQANHWIGGHLFFGGGPSGPSRIPTHAATLQNPGANRIGVFVLVAWGASRSRPGRLSPPCGAPGKRSRTRPDSRAPGPARKAAAPSHGA